MKKLLTVILVPLLSLGVLAQENQTKSAFQKISEPPNQVLSTTHQSRLQKLQQSDNLISVTLIKTEGLEQAVRNESLSFDLPGIPKNSTAETISLDYASENNFTWKGTFTKGEAFLTQENGRTYGQIRSDGKVFDIQYLEGGYAVLIEYDMEKLNETGCAIPIESKSGENEQNRSKSPETAESIPIPELATATGGAYSTVRTLVLFTPAAVATGLDMADIANIARDQWQTAQSNSNGSANLEIAGVQELDFFENDDPDSDPDNGGTSIGWISTDIILLRDDTVAQQLRNQFEADIVILLTNGFYPGIAGIAFVGPNDDSAYGLVQVANATSTYTFIHETGHIFGARHEFDDTPHPGEAHGHDWQKTTGWWFWEETKKYGSVMRTQEPGRTRVLQFSNPFVTHADQATGVTGISFNTIVINQNGHTVEDFRFTQPDFATSIFGPGSADNGDLLLFSSGVSNGTAPYAYQWKAKTTGQYFNVGGNSSTLIYTMPVDSDLQLLLTVTDANNEQATGYQMVQNLFSGGGGPCNSCPDSLAFDKSKPRNIVDERPALSDQLGLYPNPASQSLQIIFGSDYELFERYQIIDLKGTIILESTLDANQGNNKQLDLDIAPLQPATYIIKILGNNGNHSFRFVKQ